MGHHHLTQSEMGVLLPIKDEANSQAVHARIYVKVNKPVRALFVGVSAFPYTTRSLPERRPMQSKPD